ncbi:MAG TPA: EF-hand domain-containing protein [Sphingobium sp.]
MIRRLLLSSLLLIAAPATAQDAAAPSAGSAQETTDSVASIVNSEFPAYDANNDDQLDKPEFERWMVALKQQEMKTTGKTLAPAEITAWADGAFATADADKSISVSKPELITYLSAGAS